MIEIPESLTISRQTTEILTGRKICGVEKATSPHKFAFYNGDPVLYPELLTGQKIKEVNGYGAFVDVVLEEETHLLTGDGTNMHYYRAGELKSAKYQLLIVLDEGDCPECQRLSSAS